MTPHINAKPQDIAPYVLMPGDPLRAKFMAETFLTDVHLVNNVRNVFMYTGCYKSTLVTIAASGMGQPSIGIYAYELFKFYNVQVIIRVGTAGAYSPNLKVFDVINVSAAYSSNNEFAKVWLGKDDHVLCASENIFDLLNATIIKENIPVINGIIHSNDIFYRPDDGLKFAQTMLDEYQCLGVEMESFALFAAAQHFNRQAACLLTISDAIANEIFISSTEREQKTKNMFYLALEALITL